MKQVLSGGIAALLVAASLTLLGAAAQPLAASAASNPTITCTSPSALFNTGYNSATGMILADGATDANWEVSGPYGTSTPTNANAAPTWATVQSVTGWGIEAPPTSATWTAGIVGNAAPGAWYASPANNAQWISQGGKSATQAGPGPSWYYRYNFNIDPAVDTSNFALLLSFYADNSVAEVYVNGVAQSAYNSTLPQANSPLFNSGYAAGNGSSVSMTHGWQSGANSIVVQTFSGKPQEGFAVQASTSATCPAPAYTVSTTADRTAAVVGDDVTYTVTFKNTGNTALPTGTQAVTGLDDLAAVLDDATYNNDATGSPTYVSTSGHESLAWTVPSLAVGASVSYTYSVKVVGAGNGSLNSSVSATNAAIGSCPSNCTTTTAVQKFTPSGTPISTPQNTAKQMNISALVNTSTGSIDPTYTPAVPTGASAPQHGTVTTSAGKVTYTPTPGYTGPDSFVLHVCDTSSPQLCGDVTIPVQVGANTVTAVADTDQVAAGSAVTTAVLGNDTSASGQALAKPVVIVTPPAAAAGTATAQSDGTVIFTASPTFSGVASYVYKVCDTSTGTTPACDQATVTITVLNVVTAVDDTASVASGSSVATVVTTNDTEANPNKTLTASVTTIPQHGTTTVGSDGHTITYTPTTGYSGTDSYVYTLCDNSSTPVCDPATVTINVTNTITASPSGAATPQNALIALPVTDLVHTTGAALDPAATTIVTQPTHGTVTVSPAGLLTYTPTAGYAGPDSYQVRVCDQSSPQQCVTVTVPVTVGPNVVTAMPDTMPAAADRMTTLNVLANDISRTGQPLDPNSLAVTSTPAHGTVAIVNGKANYTPNAGYSGADSFRYTVCDDSNPTPVCDFSLVTLAIPVPVDDPTTRLAETGTHAGIVTGGGILLFLGGFVLVLWRRRSMIGEAQH